MPELTAADMAEHEVTFSTGANDTATRIFVAAYVAADEAKVPGMLAFKDHQHRIVALVNAATVLTVERLDRGENAPPAAQPQVILKGQTTFGAAPQPQTLYWTPGAFSGNA
jgi:hypothetical protein